MVPLNLDFSSSFVFVVFVVFIVFIVYSVFIAHFVHFLDLVCSSGRKFQCEQRRSGSSSSSRFNGSQ